MNCTLIRAYGVEHLVSAFFLDRDRVNKYQKDCFSSKLHSGVILKTQRDFGFVLNMSMLIGDNETDMQAGVAAGVETNLMYTIQIPLLRDRLPSALQGTIAFLAVAEGQGTKV